MPKIERKLMPSTIFKAKKIKLIIALALNILIIGFTIGGLWWAWIRFGHQGGWFWGWYTYLSALVVGFSSLMFEIWGWMAFAKKQVELPNFIYILKNVGTAAIMITFIISFVTFLAHTNSKGAWEPKWSVYEKSNFIIHIVIPVIAFCSNILCERTIKMKWIENLYGGIPSLIYCGHYLAVGYTHLKPDGTIEPGPSYDSDRFDRYGVFKLVGPKLAWLMIPAFLAATFLICWLCWLINRKIHIFEEKAPKIELRKHKTQRVVVAKAKPEPVKYVEVKKPIKVKKAKPVAKQPKVKKPHGDLTVAIALPITIVAIALITMALTLIAA